MNFKNDVIIITNLNETSDEKYLHSLHLYMEDLKKTCGEINLTCQTIYQPQTCLDFNDYFLTYRMRLLVIIKLDSLKNVSP